MDIIGTHTLGSSGQKDRSRLDGEDFLQRSLKLATTKTLPEEEEAVYCKTMSFQQDIPVMRSASSDSRRQEHMLSFSDKPEAIDFTKYVGLDNNNSNNNNNNNNNNNKSSSLSPFLHQIPPSYYRSSGGGGGGGYGGYGGMMMSMQGNLTGVKGPFTLTQWAELEQQALIYKYITANVPVPSGLLISIKKSFYPYGSLPPTSYGWGTFHLGFASGNMDPEPGRCRRTDGKKWRCSRDAVPDQKYCERHINRGRHRSRKPVEVQSGQTAAAAVAASKAVTKPQQSVVSGGSNRSNARTSSNRGLPLGGQYNNLSIDSLPNNRVLNPLVSSLYPTKESPAVQQKHHRSNNNPFEFGHISSDSLLNPSSAKNNESSSYLDFSCNQDKHSGSWPGEMKSDWTQLSMSIPIASSSPSSTHNNGQAKIAPSPLSLSQEYDSSIQTEESQEAVKKVNTWIPISWGNNSLGGPLGEVLNSTTNSPTLGSSPNSSCASIPFGDSNRNNGGDYFHYTT